jgi:hypothetical protein
MKSIPMRWAISAVIAICVTPGFGRRTQTSPPPHPAMLAQDSGPVAVPGSADAPPPNAADDTNDQSGQAVNNGQKPGEDQTPGDPDAAQQPPMNTQPAPADDNGDDTSAQQQQQPGDNGDEGATSAPPSSGDDN